MKILPILIIFIFLPLSSALSENFPYEIEGKVIAIADGDTITILDQKKVQYKIRLSEIDAPEKGQPYGNKSKGVLSDLIFKKNVTAIAETKDRYGRIIAKIIHNNKDVNAEMVRSGAAWVYRKYNKDESLYEIENEARENKRGVWGLTEAKNMAPWEWRRR